MANFLNVTEVMQNKNEIETEINLDNVERFVKNEGSQTIVVFFSGGDTISIKPFDTSQLRA